MQNLNSQIKTYISIYTDLETDDIWAIYILAQIFKFDHIVVGEGNASIKQKRMELYIQLLKKEGLDIADPIVVKGENSNKNFKYDGQEFEDLDNVKTTDYSFETVTKEYLTKYDEPILVILKPCRELIEFAEKYQDLIKKTKVYFYGGFNFRCLFRKYKPDIVANFISSFKNAYIYESFHALGEFNSLNKCSKYIYNKFVKAQEKSEYINKIKIFNKLWNEDLKEKCVDVCNKLLIENNITQTCEAVFDILLKNTNPKKYVATLFTNIKQSEQFFRNFKTYKSINGHEDFQVVLADMCAVLAFFNSKYNNDCVPAKISFDEAGYTQFELVEASNVYFYKNLTKEEMLEDLANSFI